MSFLEIYLAFIHSVILSMIMFVLYKAEIIVERTKSFNRSVVLLALIYVLSLMFLISFSCIAFPGDQNETIENFSGTLVTKIWFFITLAINILSTIGAFSGVAKFKKRIK